MVDGDSFAHRAYHALPKTIRRDEGRPAGALVGFTNMLVRLWEAESPRAVLVAWDTLEAPTYRHEVFPGYPAGREFDAELLEQLDLLAEALVGANPAGGLYLHRQPVCVLVRHGLEQRAVAALEPDVDEPIRGAGDERDEQRFLAREVVEDRATREPGLLLEACDRRPLVAVPRECPLSALEDLLATALLVLVGDLGHSSIL